MSYIYARKGDVVVKYATVTGGTAGAFNSIGCLSGDLVVPRSASPSSSELDNWCVSQDGTVQQVELGELVIEPTFTIEMDLAGTVLTTLEAAFHGGDTIALQVIATDALNNKHELEYWGYIVNDDLQFRGGAGATSQVNFTFHVNEVKTDTVTPHA